MKTNMVYKHTRPWPVSNLGPYGCRVCQCSLLVARAARPGASVCSSTADYEFLRETSFNGNASNAAQWGTEEHQKHTLRFICRKEINSQQGIPQDLALAKCVTTITTRRLDVRGV